MPEAALRAICHTSTYMLGAGSLEEDAQVGFDGMGWHSMRGHGIALLNCGHPHTLLGPYSHTAVPHFLTHAFCPAQRGGHLRSVLRLHPQ